MPAAKSPRPWKVMPHAPLREVDEGLWVLDSVVPGIPGHAFPRTMGVVRLRDGSLLLHNAIPADEPTMAALAALGPISTILLPSAFHCMDAHAMAARTGARVLCPAASRARIEEVVRVDGDLSALPADPAVRWEPLAGNALGEGVLVVARGGRVSYLVCDVLLAVPHLPGFWGLVWRLAGFTGRGGPSPLWKRKVMTDAAALRRDLLRLADRPGLARIVPSHGPVLDADPAGALRRAAAQL
jgi:glyoxylase-like metal-dependent hydrolase (beta-lactamase superfamily II)